MKYLGVSSWRGWNVTFSDGMCTDCAARARAEWSLPATAPRPVPVPRPPRILRPDFALATGVLLLILGVGIGVLIGPPPRTVSQPIEPAMSVASQDSGERVGVRPGATAAPSASPRAERGGSTSNDRVAAVVHDAVTDPDRARARPIRIVRTSAKRPARGVYRPESVAIEFVSVPESRVETAPAMSPEEISPLARIRLQAP